MILGPVRNPSQGPAVNDNGAMKGKTPLPNCALREAKTSAA